MPLIPKFTKYYMLLPTLSILFITIGYFTQKRKNGIYPKNKFYKLILKKKKIYKRGRTLAVIPKLIFILLAVSKDVNENNSSWNTIGANKSFLGYNYSFISNNCLAQLNQLYALSKLKYKNHATFCKFLLLLSGDIEINPGPEYPCNVCQKNISLRHRVLCCKRCDTWVHKKCANISEHRYKSIKNKEDGFYFDCGKCNYTEEFPFFQEEYLEESFLIDSNDEENILDLKEIDMFQQRGLHFIHLNINSILPKIDELRLIAAKTNAAVIGITESKIDESVLDGEIRIDGYIPVRKDRNRQGGGVVCYIRQDIPFNKIEIQCPNIEHIFLDIFLPKTKPILIGILYRPPKQRGFLNTLSTALGNIPNLNSREIHILGDININLIYHGQKTPMGIKKYYEFCAMLGLIQIINNATRITETTSSLLDHILTNSKDKISQSGVIDIGISDHQMIFCTRKISRPKIGGKTFIKIRCLKNYSEEKLIQNLSNCDFPNYTNFDDVNKAYSDFIDRTSDVINKIAPIKEICIKNNTAEWFDEEVLEGIKIRDKLFKKFKKSKSNIDNTNYKKYRNKLQDLIKRKKRNYISQNLTDNISKPKKLWQSLKKLGLPCKNGPTSTICLGTNENISFENKENAEKFKNFYENLATDLLNKLPLPANEFNKDKVNEYYKHLNIQDKNFILKPVTYDCVLNLLKKINPNKSVGIDNLGGRFLKDGAKFFAKFLTQLLNLSIKKSVFPDKCKIAKLKPLYKKGSKIEPKNYRPISLLPLVSKIFEKIVHYQTQDYLDTHKILYKYQSGFRTKHSTDTCLTLLNNEILNGIDKGCLTGMIFIDLQKAFDTIDHDIFLQKLECIGFSNSAILWYRSYLENRTFQVNIENDYSNLGKLNCGVPQGSILGPLIFLIYVNDMPQSVDCDLFLYADDTCVGFTDNNIKTIENNLNRNFNSLCDWFVENKLSIHFGEDKTKSIVFGSKRRLKNIDKLDIRRGNIKISQQNKVTYLGCILDDSLSGESMALRVLKKVNGRLSFLYRKQSFLSYKLRRMLCNALIQPHFDYACSAWYPNLTKNLTKKFQISQNKCIRFCLGLDNRTHIGVNHFKTINWLPVQSRFEQCVAMNAYKFCKGMGPAYMCDTYSLMKNLQTTRRSVLKLELPLKKTNMGQSAISYIGPKVWNNLPSECKLEDNPNKFKHKMKEEFFKCIQHKDDDIYMYY